MHFPHLHIDTNTSRLPWRARATRVVQYNVCLLVFVIMAVVAFRKGLAQQRWHSLPCTIVSSGVVNDPDDAYYRPFHANVTYQFWIDGELTNGHDERNSDKPAKLEAFVRQYPMGMKTICWFDPDNHKSTVLVRQDMHTPVIVFTGFAIAIALMWWLYCIPTLRRDVNGN